MTDAVTDLDVLIIGAGPVGMTLALALQDSPLRVKLLDRRPLAAHSQDPRALALSHGARQLLARLGAWPESRATAIKTIHISQRGGFGRSFMNCRDYDLPALGYVVRYASLSEALQAVLNPGVVLDQSEVSEIRPEADGVRVTLVREGREQVFRSRLVVHAEGTPADDPDVKVCDYHQWAVIAEVATEPGHGHCAWERFTPDGPLALLPLGQTYSIVFTLPPEKARQVLAMDDGDFLVSLQNQFGSRLRFTGVSPRSHFPLALRWRQTLVQGRELWIGNAAQTLHPVSGQGFNLGLRDAWQLAEILLQRGVEVGQAESLQRYLSKRRLDRGGSALFTDQVVRLFSNDFGPLRLGRGLALTAMDMLPPLRHFVAKRMIWGARAWP